MSIFSKDLSINEVDDGRNFELAKDFCYQSDRYGITICAPAGFVFDFASIPRMFWRVVGSPATGLYRRASVIHDYLCVHGAELGISRAQADSIFYEAMLCNGVGLFKAWVMYRAVRLNSIFRCAIIPQ